MPSIFQLNWTIYKEFRFLSFPLSLCNWISTHLKVRVRRGVLPQVRVCAHEYHRGVLLLLCQLWNPIGLHVAERFRIDDAEAHEEDVTSRIAQLSQCRRVRRVLAGRITQRHMHWRPIHFHLACGPISSSRRENKRAVPINDYTLSNFFNFLSLLLLSCKVLTLVAVWIGESKIIHLIQTLH